MVARSGWQSLTFGYNYMNSSINLPAKWVELRSEDIGNLEIELARETCQSHPLYKVQVKALYRRYPQDYVLFEVYDADYPYYCVHLTWSIEKDPYWPSITKFRSLEDFCSNYETTLEITDEDSKWKEERWRFFEP